MHNNLRKLEDKGYIPSPEVLKDVETFIEWVSNKDPSRRLVYEKIIHDVVNNKLGVSGAFPKKELHEHVLSRPRAILNYDTLAQWASGPLVDAITEVFKRHQSVKHHVPKTCNGKRLRMNVTGPVFTSGMVGEQLATIIVTRRNKFRYTTDFSSFDGSHCFHTSKFLGDYFIQWVDDNELIVKCYFGAYSVRIVRTQHMSADGFGHHISGSSITTLGNSIINLLIQCIPIMDKLDEDRVLLYVGDDGLNDWSDSECRKVVQISNYFGFSLTPKCIEHTLPVYNSHVPLVDVDGNAYMVSCTIGRWAKRLCIESAQPYKEPKTKLDDYQVRVLRDLLYAEQYMSSGLPIARKVIKFLIGIYGAVKDPKLAYKSKIKNQYKLFNVTPHDISESSYNEYANYLGISKETLTTIETNCEVGNFPPLLKLLLDEAVHEPKHHTDHFDSQKSCFNPINPISVIDDIWSRMDMYQMKREAFASGLMQKRYLSFTPTAFQQAA